MQNPSPATDRCIPRWYFKFPTDFYEKCRKIIVVPSTIPSSLFFFQPQHPVTRNWPISECTSGMVRTSLWLAKLPAKTSHNYLHQISWISIKFFAEHIVKMLLKHCKKFTAAEITELVKITKQEIGALPTSSNGMSVLLIDSLDSTVLLLYVQNIYFQVI